MQITLWGTRGSIPCPGESTKKYGGNSACIELRVGADNRLLVIDAGSGIRALGNHLLKQDSAALGHDITLFLTHTHWDHIIGFPYFTPIYLAQTKMDVYGPASFEKESLEEMVGGQLKYRHFPINMGELSSHIRYHRLQERNEFDLGDGLLVRTKFLNHPVATLGYRFEYGGKVFCTCYDSEPFRNLFITDPADPEYDEMLAYEGEQAAMEQNDAVAHFFAGADLLIHDAQYTAAEYATKVGWGHSPIESVIESAAAAGVKHLLLFHHDPDRSDAELDAMSDHYCGKHGEMVVEFAREGARFNLA